MAHPTIVYDYMYELLIHFVLYGLHLLYSLQACTYKKFDIKKRKGYTESHKSLEMATFG